MASSLSSSLPQAAGGRTFSSVGDAPTSLSSMERFPIVSSPSSSPTPPSHLSMSSIGESLAAHVAPVAPPSLPTTSPIDNPLAASAGWEQSMPTSSRNVEPNYSSFPSPPLATENFFSYPPNSYNGPSPFTDSKSLFPLTSFFNPSSIFSDTEGVGGTGGAGTGGGSGGDGSGSSGMNGGSGGLNGVSLGDPTGASMAFSVDNAFAANSPEGTQTPFMNNPMSIFRSPAGPSPSNLAASVSDIWGRPALANLPSHQPVETRSGLPSSSSASSSSSNPSLGGKGNGSSLDGSTSTPGGGVSGGDEGKRRLPLLARLSGSSAAAGGVSSGVTSLFGDGGVPSFFPNPELFTVDHFENLSMTPLSPLTQTHTPSSSDAININTSNRVGGGGGGGSGSVGGDSVGGGDKMRGGGAHPSHFPRSGIPPSPSTVHPQGHYFLDPASSPSPTPQTSLNINGVGNLGQVGRSGSAASVGVASSSPNLESGDWGGDWNCPRCSAVNFARRIECYKCNESRPVDYVDGRPRHLLTTGRRLEESPTNVSVPQTAQQKAMTINRSYPPLNSAISAEWQSLKNPHGSTRASGHQFDASSPSASSSPLQMQWNGQSVSSSGVDSREDMAHHVYEFIRDEGGSALFSKIGLNIKVDGKMSAFIQSFPSLFEIVGSGSSIRAVNRPLDKRNGSSVFTSSSPPADGFFDSSNAPPSRPASNAAPTQGATGVNGKKIKRICHFYQFGKCRSGDACRFLHVSQ